jgi:predicted phosphodiesterase
MRLQYASDLHLERWPKTTYEEVLKPAVAPALVLLGDICPLDNAHLRPFFEWCSEKWKTVIWIPGDLEVWFSGFAHVSDAVAAMKHRVSPFQNVHVLYCEAMGSDDGLVLLGCPLWRRPRDEVMLHVTGKIWAKSDPCPADKGLFLYEYNQCRRWLQTYLAGCLKPVVVLGCYAPLPWLTEEEWIQEKTSSTNAPELELLLRPPLVAWLYGHCHVPNTENYSWTATTGQVNTVLLTSNPRGYPLVGEPGEKKKTNGFKMDAVVRIDPALYLDASSA